MTDHNHAPNAAKPPAVFLLAIWGASYINQFCELGLRSLLAPGNIPAMSEKYDCTFIFLTRRKDHKLFSAHPLFHLIEDYCRVEFIDIDDLVFPGNYSATVTIAYERGMRSRGTQITNTYFIYLVSDYIMADGSLTGLMRYMHQGYSGITAGNFQAVQEEMEIPLQQNVDKLTGILAMPPRQLLAQAFNYLHPITTANTVNQPFSHTLHTNRLFWRIDDHTLLGRFYLRHMLCIKPELDNYVIGASCDYSFIPELCPSGNIVHIADSDDYCVIELQPASHEHRLMRYGQVTKEMLVKTLSEWTTAQHRANAYAPVLFHAADIPATADDYIAKSRSYVEAIEKKLPASPKPFRKHPYWVSCIEWCLQHLLKRFDFMDHYLNGVFAGILGSPVFEPGITTPGSDYILLRTQKTYPLSLIHRFIRHVEGTLTGMTVRPGPFHPYWHEYRLILSNMRKLMKSSPSALFISQQPVWLVDWLHKRYGEKVIFQQAEFFTERPAEKLKRLAEAKPTVAMLFLSNSESQMVGHIVKKSRAYLAEGGTMAIYLLNKNMGKRNGRLQSFIVSMAPHISDLQSLSMTYHTPLFRTIPDTLAQPSVRHVAFPSRRVRLIRLLAAGLLVAVSISYPLINLLGLSGIRRNLSRASAVIFVLKNHRRTLTPERPAKGENFAGRQASASTRESV